MVQRVWQTLRKLRPRLATLMSSAALGYISLGVLEAKVLWGAWHNWDLPMWDGSTYFIYGRRVANSLWFPPLEWSPGFAGYYAIFHILFGGAGPFVIYFAHRIVAIVAVPVLFYALLRATLPAPIAWLLAAYFITLQVGFANHYVVHLFVGIPLLGAYLFSLSKSAFGSSLLLTCLLLAATVRSEFFMSFAAMLAVLVYGDFTAVRDKQVTARKVLQSYVPLFAGIAVVILLIVRAGPSHITVNRAWGAFMQHYALGYQERHPEWNVNPWFKYREAIEISFGDVNSFTEALLRNPLAVVTHVAWNARLLPELLIDVLSPFSTASWAVLLVGMGVGSLLVTIVAGKQGRWQRPFQAIRLRVVEQCKLWLVTACTLMPFLISALLVRPRSIYFVPPVLSILPIAGLGLEALWLRYRPLKHFRWVLPLVFLVLLVVIPSPFSTPSERRVSTTADFLKELPLEGTYGLLGASARGFCIYSAPDQCQGFEIIYVPADQTSFSSFIQENNIRVILVDHTLTDNLPPTGQQFIAGLEAEPAKMGWQALGHSGGFDVYVRREE
jgi:hypothetical protein